MTETTHFGDQTVPKPEKARLVRGVFESVADRYDLMNDLMSGGVHRLWKDEFVAEVAPRAGERFLDVAGGTGDVALRLLDAAGGPATGACVIVCDLTPAMLARGRDRAIDDGRIDGLAFVGGDAQRLPLPDRCVDAYTIAFGLRNVTEPERALAEAARVLRPGGRFHCLEFSHVVLPGLDRLYDIYADAVLPWLGRNVAGDEPAYRYLVESIRRFPRQGELARMMERAGLARPRWRNLSGGIAAIHSAWRI
ncbi:MAG: class I SAM-dependent methyltransferase [Alphaproteobacteria bacterium]|nr:class I SAM-dependent methyltransferase [Alphaproteobacteria bacterium]